MRGRGELREVVTLCFTRTQCQQKDASEKRKRGTEGGKGSVTKQNKDRDTKHVPAKSEACSHRQLVHAANTIQLNNYK